MIHWELRYCRFRKPSLFRNKSLLKRGTINITINTKLDWNEHCDKLVTKANSQLGLLMRTCHFTMDRRQKKTLEYINK